MRYALIIFGLCAVVLFGFEWSVSSVCASSPDGASAKEPFDPGKELNPLMSFQQDTAVFTALIFLLMVFFLGKFAFFPIMEGLKRREQSVADNIASAERANVDAKELLGQYQQKLNDAQAEVRQILDAGKKEAEQAGIAILEKAKQASESERVQTKKEIEAATTNALQELATKSATLATELAGKIIKSKITPESQKDLIAKAVKDFTKKS